MLFHTAGFFGFLALVLALFYVFPKSWRTPLLVAASYWFYGSWNVKFIPVLLGLTLVDYWAALAIARAGDDSRKRKLFLLASLVANLGMLAFFKYTAFLLDNAAAVLGFGPGWKNPASSIVLPLGISFHTFQSISYIVDVYRGTQAPVRRFLDYALFISFFPQLVAGPIVRARVFFADWDNWRAPLGGELLRGVLLVALGLAKKVVIADQMAVAADRYFANPTGLPGIAEAWGGVVAFAMQIYFDFSGYTDMAIGIALLFGFHFPLNFRRPYLAASITEFWRRWHISLSEWLRDYLYIPLGGNRGGALLTYRNLMLTMLLGGLWHGASWNFVIWGGYHGALLSLERRLGVRADDPAGDIRWGLMRMLRVALTFVLACAGWVFFRAATLRDSGYVLRQMFAGSWQGQAVIPVWQWVLLGLCLWAAFAEERRQWLDRLPQGRAWAYVSCLGLLLLGIEMFGAIGEAKPFVYFQF